MSSELTQSNEEIGIEEVPYTPSSFLAQQNSNNHLKIILSEIEEEAELSVIELIYEDEEDDENDENDE